MEDIIKTYLNIFSSKKLKILNIFSVFYLINLNLLLGFGQELLQPYVLLTFIFAALHSNLSKSRYKHLFLILKSQQRDLTSLPHLR